ESGEELFYCPRRCVSLLGDDGVLDGLVLFIDDAKLLTVLWIHKLHFDLAELAILYLIGGAVGKRVLIAERGTDVAEDIREFAVEAGKERLPAGLTRESIQLVIGLQEIHAHRVRHVSIGHNPESLQQANGVNRNSSFLN